MSFKEDVKNGNKGELFATKHIEEITGLRIFDIKTNDMRNDENKYYAQLLRESCCFDEDYTIFQKECMAKEYEVMADADLEKAGQDIDGGHIYYSKDSESFECENIKIEVKSDFKNILTRDNNYDNPCGTLGFELYNESGSKGFLYDYLYPEEVNKESLMHGDIKTAHTPNIFIYVLYQTEESNYPFCTVSFSNFRKLTEYLNEQTNGLLMPKWNIPEYKSLNYGKDKHILRHGGKPGRMYHVGLDELLNIDGARLMMVGNSPIISEQMLNKYQIHDKKNRLKIAKQRLDYLEKTASGRIALPD